MNTTFIVNELKIYESFFTEYSYFYSGGFSRVWRYKDTESELVRNKPIFSFMNEKGKIEGTIYDYSPFLTTKITIDNYKTFLNTCDVKWWKLNDKDLTADKVKEILKNNALLANTGDKIFKQIHKMETIDSMF